MTIVDCLTPSPGTSSHSQLQMRGIRMRHGIRRRFVVLTAVLVAVGVGLPFTVFAAVSSAPAAAGTTTTAENTTTTSATKIALAVSGSVQCSHGQPVEGVWVQST